MRDSIHCARLLAFVTGLVNQELLLQNEYLVAENRILRAHLPTRLRLSNSERSTLAEIGKRLGRKALSEVARTAKPDTILGWYQRLIAHKFDCRMVKKSVLIEKKEDLESPHSGVNLTLRIGLLVS